MDIVVIHLYKLFYLYPALAEDYWVRKDMVDHPERARYAVGQGCDHLANLGGCYVSASQPMACIMLIAALDEERTLVMAVFGEVFLESRDEEVFSCLETFPRQDTWPCLEHMDHDVRFKVAIEDWFSLPPTSTVDLGWSGA